MGQIKVEKNAGGIQGLCVIEPTVHGDARGYFMETYNQKDMEEFLNVLAESFLLPDDNGNCQAFFSLIRWFLGPAAENVLSKYGYAI